MGPSSKINSAVCEEDSQQETETKMEIKHDKEQRKLCSIGISKEQNWKKHLRGSKNKKRKLKEEVSAEVVKLKQKGSKKRRLSSSPDERSRSSKKNKYHTEVVEEKPKRHKKRKLPDSDAGLYRLSKKVKHKPVYAKEEATRTFKRRKKLAEIRFPEKPVPRHVFLALQEEAKRFLREFGFGPLTDVEEKYIESFARKVPCTVSQIKSSIRCAAELAALFNHRKIKPMLREVKRASVDFLSLSRRIFTPPTNIIRQYLALKLRKSKKARVKTIKLIKTANDFDSVQDKLGKLSKHEFQEIKNGIQQDNFTGPEATARELRFSLEFENNLAEHFRSKKLPFLREEGIKQKYGKKGPTPDFLFEEEVSINGVKSFWIDAKNFMASKELGRMRISKLRKQARRYIEAFGSGAFVFSDSFVAGFHDLDMPDLSLRNGQDFAPESASLL